MREKFEAEQEETIPAFLEEPVTPTIPLFIQREESVEQETANRGALRGTAVHRVMECYDFASEKSVHEQMEAMEKEEKITADMRALVREQTVADFVPRKQESGWLSHSAGEHFTVRNHLSWDLRKRNWKDMALGQVRR